MSYIYNTLFSAEKSLENLESQGNQINTMLNNTENINEQLSISERILKSMTSFFYRINYSKESIDSKESINNIENQKIIHKKIQDKNISINKTIKVNHNINKNINVSLLEHLKYLNLEIGSELTKQNDNLLKLSNNIDNSKHKFKTIDTLF